MSAKTTTEETKPEQIHDDISQVEVKSDTMDSAKLAALKAKSQAKQQESKMAGKIIAQKEKAIRIGVIGTGQGGSRLAEAFYKQGYTAIVFNTAIQDLKFIDLPDTNKLLLENGIGGASKELSLGAAAAERHKTEILELINSKLNNSQVNILCLSLGGGSGAGSLDVMIECLQTTEKPLVVMAVLPMHSDDAKTKSNSLETLAKLASMAKNKTIANLMVIDNSKLESIYHNVDQMNFYPIANKAIVAPIDAFNEFATMPSNSKSLDPMEWSKLLIDGEGLSIYGELTVENFAEDDTAIANAVIQNLEGNLLASGFNLKESKYVGFIVAANQNCWSKISSASVNYASAMINDVCSAPLGSFRGLYVSNNSDDVVKVYSFFSGLSLPEERITELKKEVLELQSKIKEKDTQRNLNLHLDKGATETTSAAQKIKEKIMQKNSTFGKFVSGSVVDRRNK